MNTVLKRCHPRRGREAAVGDPGKKLDLKLDPHCARITMLRFKSIAAIKISRLHFNIYQ